MQSVSLASVHVAHALGLEVGPFGTAFHRFPAWVHRIHTDPSFAMVQSMPSGVRIELVTDSDRIELDVGLTLIDLDGVRSRPAAFDLVADGVVVDTQRTDVGTRVAVDSATGGVSFTEGGPATVVFDGIAPADVLEIWLPQAAGLRLLDLRVVDGASVEPPTRHRRRWVHHGSSISHCMEADQPTGTWPAVAAMAAGVDLHNLAVAGQCQLDQFAARTIRDTPADMISLKLGINVVNGDTMRERAFVPAVHGFLDTVRDGHPDTPIVVISPIHCPSVETQPGPTVSGADRRFTSLERPTPLALGALNLVRIRELLEQVVAVRRELGDQRLTYLDGLQLFGADEVDDLPDLLHPNAAGYRRMGERFHRFAFDGGGPLA